MNKKELIEKAGAFIESEYELREEIRHHISAILIDTDEEHPMKTDIAICVDKYYPVAYLDAPHITKCWQHPTEGLIYFHIEGFEFPIHFDDMTTEELITILEEID